MGFQETNRMEAGLYRKNPRHEPTEHKHCDARVTNKWADHPESICS